MKSLQTSELRLLHRLAIEPSDYQAKIAKELQVSRSAVNQIWKTLETERHLKIRSIIDYGQVGFYQVFGWAKSSQMSDVIKKFVGWLRSSPYVSVNLESMMSSTMDNRVYFEAIVPIDRLRSFQEQLQRFTKKPYGLAIAHNVCTAIANHLNLAEFDGTRWNMIDGFRLEATIDAAKEFSDILPLNRTLKLTEPNQVDIVRATIAASVEDNYQISSRELTDKFRKNQIECPSDRTLRRRLAQTRLELAIPYICINEIGLTQKVVVCIEEEHHQKLLSKLLHAQSSMFPRSRVLSGSNLTVLELLLPEETDWLSMSTSFGQLAKGPAQICTFITDPTITRKGLESILPHISSTRNTQRSHDSNEDGW